MKEKTYKLTFLPLFEKDLNKVVDYISLKLKNPSAAHRLVDDVEQAILKRLDSPPHFRTLCVSQKQKVSILQN